MLTVRFQTIHQLPPQIVDVFGNPVREVGIFRLRPYELDRIEFRRVCWQPAGLEPGTFEPCESVRRRAVDVQAVPNQQQRSSQMIVDRSQKSHHVVRVVVMVQKVVIQAESSVRRGDSQGASDAQAVVSCPRMANRSLPARSPHISPQRLQKEAAFIDKNNASLVFGPLFLVGATLPDANARWLLHPVRVLGTQAFERSNRVGAATCRHNRRCSSRGTAARSAIVPVGNSSPALEIPKNPPPLAAIPKDSFCSSMLALAEVRDAAWLSIRHHPPARKQPSSALPKKRPPRRPQPLSSAYPPAQEAGLQSVDGLRAPRGFHEVSWTHCTQLSLTAH